MAIINSPMQSMTPVYDDAYNAALANDGSITVVNYSSGAGKLALIGFYSDQGIVDIATGLTIDGGSEDIAEYDDTYAAGGQVWVNRTDAAGNFGNLRGLDLEFTSSVVVKIYNRSGGAAAVFGSSYYGILSREISRKIIPAGSKLPDREYVEPVDVLCIYIDTGSGNLASRLVYPVEMRVNEDAEEVQESQFIEAPNGPTRRYVRKNFTGKIKHNKDGVFCDLNVSNGIINTAEIPHIITVDEFWDRFTDEQENDMDQSGDRDIKQLISKANKRGKINIKSGWVINAMDRALQTINSIDQEDYDRILAIP